MVLLKYQTMNIACMENRSVFLVVLECNVLVMSEFTSPSNGFFWWRAFFLFTHKIVSNFYLNNSFSFRNGYNLFASRPLMESFKTKTWFFLRSFIIARPSLEIDKWASLFFHIHFLQITHCLSLHCNLCFLPRIWKYRSVKRRFRWTLCQKYLLLSWHLW